MPANREGSRGSLRYCVRVVAGAKMDVMDTPPATTTWQHLAPNPKSAYKQLFIKGTRIRARVLYGAYMNAEEPMTPEQIAADYNLPLAAVKEAIMYCRGNPPEIEEDFRREEAALEAAGMNDPDYKHGGKYRVLSPQERARLGL
jgi:uncharacterized protein (DUF433 family)